MKQFTRFQAKEKTQPLFLLGNVTEKCISLLPKDKQTKSLKFNETK